MQHENNDLLSEIYLRHLKIINGIKFTHREIDIIGLLICGRSGKKIAAFFSISPKTVENHTHNIMIKLGCNSRESIIDFIEKSGKLIDLREYHSTLLMHASQGESLNAEEILCLFPGQEENTHNPLIHTLQSKKYIVGTVLILVLISLILFAFNVRWPTFRTMEKYTHSSIRSDLSLPAASARLARAELLSQISDRFKGWRGIQTIALVGIAGAGKTTLARLYAENQKFSIIWEINAATPESLSESFEKLSHALSNTEEDKKILTGILGIKEVPDREEKVIHFVKERLRLQSNWFLIYDNVEKFSDIQNYFPKDPSAWGQGRVILTTRDRNIENNKHINNIVVIGELDPAQKLELFTKVMGDSESGIPLNMQETEKFLTEIPPFPLDVSVAAYYLKATHIPYEKYLEYMNRGKHNSDFSNIQERILQDVGDYTKTRYDIIALSLKQLIDTNPHFQDLLLFISFLDPQNIQRNLLLKLFKDPTEGDLTIDALIHQLNKYSLITNVKEGKPSFSMHRSTQAIILSYLTRLLDLEKNKAPTRTIGKTLERTIAEALKKEDFAKMKSLLQSTEYFLSHAHLIPDDVKGTISGELGCIYYYLCNHTKAIELIEKNLPLLKPTKDEDYNKIAHFLVYLGNVYRRLGTYEKAITLFEQAIETYQKQSHPDSGMARAYGYLGIVYEDMGDFKKAKDLLEMSLEIHKRDTENRIGLAWSLAHLGSIYMNIGDYDGAKDLYEQSLALYKSNDENHVGAAWVKGILGLIYTKLKDYEKAEKLIEDSLKNSRNHFPENHIYVARASVHLGIFHRETGNFESAKSLLKKGFVTIESAYGKDHSESALVLVHLGKTWLAEGNLKMAEDTIQEALSIFSKTHHPDQFDALETLGDIYTLKSKQGTYFKNQAALYLEKALTLVTKHFPENSSHNTRIRSKLEMLGV